MTDPNVEAVRAALLKRAEFGLEKYGTDTTRTDLSLADWLRHAQLENMDAAVYLERAISMAEQVAPHRLIFPTMLRKMWSGGEVQAWLDNQPLCNQPKPPVASAEAAAWRWGYQYLQDRMKSIGRDSWAHDCDEEIRSRIARAAEQGPRT